MVKTESSQILKTGYKAPDFNLIGVDGKMYSLNNFNSKSILVIFICNHCPFVKARINDIINLQNKFNVKELQIIGINSNDPDYEGEGLDNMIKFSKEYSLNFPYVIDDTQSVAKEYGAVCTPDPFLFDVNKKLVFHGKINDALEPAMTPSHNTMEENINRLLSGLAIDKEFDPSIGCSIKWKH